LGSGVRHQAVEQGAEIESVGRCFGRDDGFDEQVGPGLGADAGPEGGLTFFAGRAADGNRVAGTGGSDGDGEHPFVVALPPAGDDGAVNSLDADGVVGLAAGRAEEGADELVGGVAVGLGDGDGVALGESAGGAERPLFAPLAPPHGALGLSAGPGSGGGGVVLPGGDDVDRGVPCPQGAGQFLGVVLGEPCGDARLAAELGEADGV